MEPDFDVLIAGAGPAGCLAARDLARNGLRVALFDRSPREKLGKSVVIEIENDIFQRVDLSPPEAGEIPYHPAKIRVFSSRDVEAYSLDGMPTTAVHLDLFSRRVLGEAERAGAVFFGGYRAEKLIRREDHVCGAVFRNKEENAEIRSRLVMDATGFEAALVRDLDPELGFGFSPNPLDEIRAANAYHEIDPEEAAHAVRNGLHADGELRIRLGTLGAYSTEFSYLSIDQNLAYILIGHKRDYPAPPMPELINNFIKSQGYYRKRLYGGEGLIRISTILDRLVCNGFMALGEAACMVIPINGSGAASGLLAGRLAARTAAEALRAGRTDTEALWPYAHRYQSTRGAILATYSAMRSMTESLGTDGIRTMLESGLSGPEDLINANLPKRFAPSPASIPRRLFTLLKNPGIARPMLRTIPSLRKLHRHYRRYPSSFEKETFGRWKEESRRIFSRITG